MYELLEGILHGVVNFGILLLEGIGTAIILVSGFRALGNLIRGESHACKLRLSVGITAALSFLLGAEVLKTIVALDWVGIGMTCALLLMRAAMVLLLHWESQHEHDSDGKKAVDTEKQSQSE